MGIPGSNRSIPQPTPSKKTLPAPFASNPPTVSHLVLEFLNLLYYNEGKADSPNYHYFFKEDLRYGICN